MAKYWVKLDENTYLLKLVIFKGKYPRIYLPEEVARKLGLNNVKWVLLEVDEQEGKLVLHKAKILKESFNV